MLMIEGEKQGAVPGTGNYQIFDAILATQMAVPSLKKGDKNAYDNYYYVPIDDYYEQVAKLAAENGLSWTIREIDFEPLPNVGKHGSLRFTFGFSLYHKDGYMLQDVSRFTVVHPVQGAQTAGSAASYAEKLFMRTLFKVVTGEQDADATDQSLSRGRPEKPPQSAAPHNDPLHEPIRPKAPPALREEDLEAAVESVTEDGVIKLSIPQTEKAWGAAAVVLRREIDKITSSQELTHLYRANVPVIKRAQEIKHGFGNWAVGYFQEKKGKLNG